MMHAMLSRHGTRWARRSWLLALPLWLASPVAAATEAAADADAPPGAPKPAVTLSVGAKGAGGGNLVTEPSHIPAFHLDGLFDGTYGGWAAGGGLYAELRFLEDHLGIELDLLYESDTNWTDITTNKVVETRYTVTQESLRIPLLVKGYVVGESSRIGLAVGPELVIALGAGSDVEVIDGQDVAPKALVDQARAGLRGAEQGDVNLVTALSIAFLFEPVAITLDLRAAFNLTQPSDYDERVSGTLQPFGVDVLASNSMDFRLLLGVAWETGL